MIDRPSELMVSKLSAVRIGHLVRDIDQLSSRTDHRGLVRFEHSHDSRYLSLIGKLKEMAVEAPKALQSRTRSGYFGGAIEISKWFTIASDWSRPQFLFTRFFLVNKWPDRNLSPAKLTHL